jgi:hypothetical protein
MKSIHRRVLVAAIAVLALAAIASASASAAEWHVGGKALTGSAKLAEKANVEEALTFAVPSLGLKMQCTGLNFWKPEIVAPGTLKVSEPVLSGCKDLEGPTGCKISEESEGLAGSATLALGTAPEDKAEFASSIFALKFTSCGAFEGPMRFTGKLLLSVPTGQQEQTEQAFVGVGTKSTTLQYEGNAVYVTGKFKLKLASDSLWSFH